MCVLLKFFWSAANNTKVMSSTQTDKWNRNHVRECERVMSEHNETHNWSQISLIYNTYRNLDMIALGWSLWNEAVREAVSQRCWAVTNEMGWCGFVMGLRLDGTGWGVIFYKAHGRAFASPRASGRAIKMTAVTHRDIENQSHRWPKTKTHAHPTSRHNTSIINTEPLFLYLHKPFQQDVLFSKFNN